MARFSGFHNFSFLDTIAALIVTVKKWIYEVAGILKN